ncbi:hypothetical protein B0H21DRAFT_826651 [Amylocystis lapponica]|nr:hypothetical protein B0H21DRAFT_826651 [Amylocystis lapponica]
MPAAAVEWPSTDALLSPSTPAAIQSETKATRRSSQLRPHILLQYVVRRLSSPTSCSTSTPALVEGRTTQRFSLRGPCGRQRLVLETSRPFCHVPAQREEQASVTLMQEKECAADVRAEEADTAVLPDTPGSTTPGDAPIRILCKPFDPRRLLLEQSDSGWSLAALSTSSDEGDDEWEHAEAPAATKEEDEWREDASSSLSRQIEDILQLLDSPCQSPVRYAQPLSTDECAYADDSLVQGAQEEEGDAHGSAFTIAI